MKKRTIEIETKKLSTTVIDDMITDLDKEVIKMDEQNIVIRYSGSNICIDFNHSVEDTEITFDSITLEYNNIQGEITILQKSIGNIYEVSLENIPDVFEMNGYEFDTTGDFIESTIVKDDKTVVFYHKDCMDGLASAYIMDNYLRNACDVEAELIPLQHHMFDFNEDVINVINKHTHIFVLDFSFNKNQTQILSDNCEYITIIDHHKTAQENLEDLNFLDFSTNVEVIFDMNHSGASLTLKYVNDRSYDLNLDIIKYIEDRDLWKWNLESSKEVSEFLRLNVTPNDVNSFEEVIHNYSIKEMIDNGKHYLEKVDNQVQKAIEVEKLAITTINGDGLVLLNTNENISEIGNAVCKKYSLPICMYFILPSKDVVLSFRSTDDIPVDVSLIAKSFGGGGHRNAAGATVSFEDLADIISTSEPLSKLALTH